MYLAGDSLGKSDCFEGWAVWHRAGSANEGAKKKSAAKTKVKIKNGEISVRREMVSINEPATRDEDDFLL